MAIAQPNQIPIPINLRATLAQFRDEMEAVNAPEVSAAHELLQRADDWPGWRQDALQVVGAWIRKRNDPSFRYFERLGLLAGRPCNCGGQ
jgi:hypothetical protein